MQNKLPISRQNDNRLHRSTPSTEVTGIRVLGRRYGQELHFVDSDRFWNPLIYIDNILTETKEAQWLMAQRDENDEVYLIERHRVKGVFLETLELNDFPLDVQTLPSFFLALPTKLFFTPLHTEISNESSKPNVSSGIPFCRRRLGWYAANFDRPDDELPMHMSTRQIVIFVQFLEK
ncbi:unnamed protein product [Protopolystoma xenopodis]|uniref:Uncharacterized protein n=1 Tax=Protopolystoma xenopodis TaxID=117903 RepID=A0A448XF87_9PLAT|nr:unnamed protein product [Protopolystoma xenopodis]